jgi:hypothetical protein
MDLPYGKGMHEKHAQQRPVVQPSRTGSSLKQVTYIFEDCKSNMAPSWETRGARYTLLPLTMETTEVSVLTNILWDVDTLLSNGRVAITWETQQTRTQ